MRTIEFGDKVLDLSLDVLYQYMDSIRRGPFHVEDAELEHIAQAFFRLDMEDVLWIMEKRGFRGLKTIRALSTHGESHLDGRYEYIDRKSGDEPAPFIPVQNWVYMHDGNHDALMVYACNPCGARLLSRKSFLVYPLKGLFTGDDIKDARYNLDANILFQPPL